MVIVSNATEAINLVARSWGSKLVTGDEVQGRGCAICTASGSVMAGMIDGQTLDGAVTTAEAFRGVMHGQPAPDDQDLGDLVALEGVQRFPVRVKCALLTWVTLLDAVRAWRSGERNSSSSTETT